MISAYAIEKNKIVHADLDNLPRRGLVWIRSLESDDEELGWLSKLSRIPLTELKESYEEYERPRLTKKAYIELIYHAPHIFKDEGLQTLEIYFYIIGRLVITIENERNAILDRIEGKCIKNTVRFMFKSPGIFLYHALDEINDNFLSIIDKISSNTEAIKKADLGRMSINELYSKSMTLAYFNQSILANLEVLNQLRKSYYKSFVEMDRKNFAELYFDKLQILDTEKIQRELIMNLIDIQAITSTEKLNMTMKRLTGLALLIAIPTLISSIYGMNINLPFQDHPNSFVFLSGFMIISTAVIMFIMRIFDWL